MTLGCSTVRPCLLHPSIPFISYYSEQASGGVIYRPAPQHPSLAVSVALTSEHCIDVDVTGCTAATLSRVSADMPL